MENENHSQEITMTRFIYAISGGNAAYGQDAQVTANLRRVVGSGILVAVGYIDPATGPPTSPAAAASATACCWW